ncbi:MULTISPECIES: hypothetical protein [Olivibacter]|uniref:Glycosyl hydrolase-like family 6 (GHL6) protein n=1 Tax=Olivibacter oleidegradans TaxID=760123 RepID=A0ABV6HMN2_9SPHI|nr:hypothetical protein [Olivibacter jilunii]
MMSVSAKNLNTSYHFIFLILLFISQGIASGQTADTPWWSRNNLRVIQTNLPAFTAERIEPKAFVDQLVEASANTLIINAGGIMAFYPTALPYHYRNPYATDTLLGEIIDRCHAQGIRVIVRVDFSRLHKSVFEAHPDWCYLSNKGERMFNDDIYVVSINAPYVQEKSFEIVSEIMDRFPIDGIFLNMPGYQTNNAYIGKYYGIDHNPYDQKRFKAFSGMDLPEKEDTQDPVFKKYQAFKQMTLDDWAQRLHKLVKTKNPAVAICTYTDQYVDIIRHESQSNTSLPYWPYNASDNVSNAMGSYPSHIISNASIQQISFQSRFNSVGPEEVRIRLYENIANGSGLDISMMGEFNNNTDPRNFPIIRSIYQFHKTHEPYYGNYRSTAKVLILSPSLWAHGAEGEEYRGIQLMLKETHIPFDVMEYRRPHAQTERLGQYKVIIIPGIPSLDSLDLHALSVAVKKGTRLFATGAAFSHHPAFLKAQFGASLTTINHDAAGNYLQVDDSSIFKTLGGQQMIHLAYPMPLYTFSSSVSNYLPILSKGRPGPPEIVGGHEPIGHQALAINTVEKQKNALLVPAIGRHYYLKGYEQHKAIFLNTLSAIYPAAQSLLKTDAPERVEMIWKQYARNDDANHLVDFQAEGHILHLINLTGFSGNTYFKPNDLHGINLDIALAEKPTGVHLLKANQALDYSWKDGRIRFTVPTLSDYEAVVIKNNSRENDVK